MISIVDYGLGNLASVKKALDFLSIKSVITSSADVIMESEAIILPGVGSFYQGMYNLNASGLNDVLADQVLNKKKKFLGICLGMQLIFEASEEADGTVGLGWVPGIVKKIDSSVLKIPHMGWNSTTQQNNISTIKDADYYFIHSYHCVPKDNNIITSTVNYGKDLVSSVQHNNIYAMQFHPEKSQSAGLALLKDILT
ncbi:glutamine amidotransferase [Pedobacter sp. AK017]|uniref:imidazole glycerol phosphate synthase subunit HisH n=1 Tax=Pedobacter sp. AK017 TaxID=2723073 RepID=UPI00161BA918|nr:imidazole glycerol phosphate synthase subunit HisH [Pedobacter sp. AK017]MBB5439640.1 glutamine amidotransferase [Pedobacter sp. AK017]